MSTTELKSEIEQWLTQMPADRLEQVLAYISFLAQWSPDKPKVNTPSKTLDDQRRAAFQRHCGVIGSGKLHGADNDSIDADLSRAYAS